MKSGGNGAAHFAHLLDVAGRFLHADDVRDGREPHERGGIDVAAGAARHVVHDDRQRRALGDGFVVLEETVGRGLVVVGRHGKQAIRAGALHLARRVNDLPSVVSACAREHRHLAARFLDANLRRCGFARLPRASGSRRSCRTEPESECLRRSDAARAGGRRLRRALPVVVNGVTSAVPTPVNGVLMTMPQWLGSGRAHSSPTV